MSGPVGDPEPDPDLNPIPLPRTCADIAEAQDHHLSALCSRKVNRLSCRCSGCETDDRFPVVIAPSDAPLLNTAYNGSGGFLTTGTDQRWEVGLGTFTALPTNWIPAFVYHLGAWVPSPFGNANWISFYDDTFQGDADVDVYFRIRFNLGSSVNPSTFAVLMDFYADNRVWEIWVNGVAQSTKPNGAGVLPQFFPALPSTQHEAPGYKEGQQVHINLNNSWRRCENEIIVHVMSAPPNIGFLAQNAVEIEASGDDCECDCKCTNAEFPDIGPCISASWGDSPCDCMETDDFEVVCVTVCNCYANVTMSNVTIGQILVTDMSGHPVAALPDGTPSVQVVPSGPICFGDIGPCEEDGHPACVSRELVVYTRGAIGQDYRLMFDGVCFEVCRQYQSTHCFILSLCQD